MIDIVLQKYNFKFLSVLMARHELIVSVEQKQWQKNMCASKFNSYLFSLFLSNWHWSGHLPSCKDEFNFQSLLKFQIAFKYMSIKDYLPIKAVHCKIRLSLLLISDFQKYQHLEKDLC